MFNRDNNGTQSNVTMFVIAILLTVSVLAILGIYTFETISQTEKIEKALSSFENNTLKIIMPNEVYTNVNINLVTNYLPKGNVIGTNIIIEKLVITNDIKTSVNTINASSKEEMALVLKETLGSHYNTLKYFMDDGYRNLIILFLVFSIFMSVVCTVTIGINNRILYNARKYTKEIESKILYLTTENTRNLDEMIKTLKNENEEFAKDLKKDVKLNSLLSKALVETLNKNYDNAITLYSAALLIDVFNSEIYSNRAYAYSQKGYYNEAIEDLNKAINMRYDVADNYYNRANIFKIKKQWYEAIEDYSKTIGLNSNFLSAYYERGTVFYNTGDYEKALSDYSRVIDMDLNNYEAYASRAFIYIKYYENTNNKLYFDKALKDLNQAIEIKSSSFTAIIYFSYLYIALYKLEKKKTQLSKAKKYLDKAAEIESNNKLLYFYQGLYNVLNGKEEDGNKLIARAAELDYNEAIKYLSLPKSTSHNSKNKKKETSDNEIVDIDNN